MKDYKQQTLQAERMLAEPCFGRTDRYHGGNCQHCCLRGDGLANTADEKGLEPNYSGWARIYVQAGRTIPARFAAAFEKEKQSDNKLYAEALADDIAHYGVTIETI
jgi:hypothetical protein